MPGNPFNKTILNRTALLPDIQVDFMWQLLIPTISKVAPTATFDLEDLLVRCRSVSIPGRTTEPVVCHYSGANTYLAGKTTNGGSFSVTFEDTNDSVIASVFYEWHQFIYNPNPRSFRAAGSSSVPAKVSDKSSDSYSLPIVLMMFGYNGTVGMKSYTFHNAWVQSIGDTEVSYSGNAAVSYTITFQYDYMTVSPDITQLGIG